MFLSIIIPVYNVEAYLGDCLDSCAEQGLDADAYEIICVDDGSTDSSGEIIDEYAGRVPGMVAVHRKNGGVSAARNTGIEQARGEYIWFADPDDFLSRGFAAKLFELVKANNEPDLITFNVYEFRDDGANGALSRAEVLEKHEIKNNRAPAEDYDAVLWRHLYKKQVIDEHSLSFDPEIRVNEDNVFHFIFDTYAESRAIFSEVGYFYRKRVNSLTASSPEKSHSSRVKTATLFKGFYENGFGNRYNAGYLLSTQLRLALLHIAKMKNPRRKRELKKLREPGLFPMKISEKDTYFEIKRPETSFFNRLYNRMYNRIYTRKGYAYIRLSVIITKIKRRLSV